MSTLCYTDLLFLVILIVLLVMFFRALKQTKKAKLKEALEIMKKRRRCDWKSASLQTKYILLLLAAYFSEDRDHTLRIFVVHIIYFTYYVVNKLNLTMNVLTIVTHYLLLLIIQVFLNNPLV